MATILIVEDTAANRVLATKILRHAGHEVTTAATGAEGVSMARERRPDIVLMDLGLPDIDGWQALKEIRGSAGESPGCESWRSRHTRWWATGSRALEAGFDGYLSKPIDVATFAEAVAELVP